VIGVLSQIDRIEAGRTENIRSGLESELDIPFTAVSVNERYYRAELLSAIVKKCSDGF
jgi:hypothetical protein